MADSRPTARRSGARIACTSSPNLQHTHRQPARRRFPLLLRHAGQQLGRFEPFAVEPEKVVGVKGVGRGGLGPKRPRRRLRPRRRARRGGQGAPVGGHGCGLCGCESWVRVGGETLVAKLGPSEMQECAKKGRRKIERRTRQHTLDARARRNRNKCCAAPSPAGPRPQRHHPHAHAHFTPHPPRAAPPRRAGTRSRPRRAIRPSGTATSCGPSLKR